MLLGMNTRHFLATLLIATGATLSAQAATVAAVSITGGSLQNNANNFALGWEFQINTSTLITALGVADPVGTGLAAATPVAVYSCADVGCSSSTGTVASVTVARTANLFNGFRYTDLSAPVTLAPGYYVIADLNLAGQSYYLQTTGFVAAPEVTYIQDRYQFSTSLLFPAATDVSSNKAYSGPNFMIYNPEPATLIMFGGGMALVGMLARRRRRA